MTVLCYKPLVLMNTKFSLLLNELILHYQYFYAYLKDIMLFNLKYIFFIALALDETIFSMFFILQGR